MNLYETLGVETGATQEEVKKAYRRAAKAHHPDSGGGDGGDAEAFRNIQAAYDTLADPEARAEYDRTGQAKGDAGSAYQKAVAETCKIFLVIASEMDEPAYQDIVAIVKDKLRNAMELTINAEAAAKKTATKYRAIADRLTVKEGKENFISSALQQQAIMQDAMAVARVEELAHLKECLKIADLFRYRMEQGRPWGQPLYGSVEFGSFSSR